MLPPMPAKHQPKSGSKAPRTKPKSREPQDNVRFRFTTKNPLEELAYEMVGDNKSPNLFFVSMEDEGAIAVFSDRDEALDFAEGVGADLVEDRLNGSIWEAGEEVDPESVEVEDPDAEEEEEPEEGAEEEEDEEPEED